MSNEHSDLNTLILSLDDKQIVAILLTMQRSLEKLDERSTRLLEELVNVRRDMASRQESFDKLMERRIGKLEQDEVLHAKHWEESEDRDKHIRELQDFRLSVEPLVRHAPALEHRLNTLEKFRTQAMVFAGLLLVASNGLVYFITRFIHG